jgi:predicted nucleotidyltransferase
MDKIDALKLSRTYLQKAKKSGLDFSEAWLFGSYAKGNQNENSDIDLAIILKDIDHTFETEVMLMGIRNGDELMIEPHPFSKDEFDNKFPLVNQIIKYGERVVV